MLYKDAVLDVIPLDVIKELLEQYKLNVAEGVHGAAHWARVAENGLMICATEKNVESADAVCIAFAFFHDICRQNEHCDPNHGLRGAELMATYKDRLNLTQREFDLAYAACSDHTDVIKNDGDILISACMDADRLDLGRVGIAPCAEYLNTEFAKRRNVISVALERSIRDYCPKWMEDILLDCGIEISL
ncbi:hypothetical protein [Photobacterium damselae]|uniref:hypothetical protein n=1 Tax=Photobacterium damselae TaxID=38293 RepID=UPI001F23156B|nr:hypothetical protein [Photobacterium damselae]UKA04887.1 hypothetical protein IHC89_21830 [Photobacterium damselae subsp. damselae]